MMHNILEKFQLFIQVNVFKNKSSNRKKMQLIFSTSPRKTGTPPLPYWPDSLQNFNNCSAPTYWLKKKIDSLQFKKGEGIENKA